MSTGNIKNKLTGPLENSQNSTELKVLQSKESAEGLRQTSHLEGYQAGSIETIPIQNSQQQNITTVEKLLEPNNGQNNNHPNGKDDQNQIMTGSENIESAPAGVRMSIPIGQQRKQNGETNKESQNQQINSPSWLQSKTQSKNTNDFLIIDIVGKSPSNVSEATGVIKIPTSESSRQPNNVLNVLHFQEYTEDKTGKELQMIQEHVQTSEELNQTKHSSPKNKMSKSFIDQRLEKQIVGITEKQQVKTFQRNLTKMSQDRKKSAHSSQNRNQKSAKSLKSLKKTMLIKKFPEQDIQELQNNMKNQKEKNFQKLQQSVINNRFRKQSSNQVFSNLNPSNANDDLVHVSSASNQPQKSSQQTHASKGSKISNKNHNQSTDNPNNLVAPSLIENSSQKHLPEEASYQLMIMNSQYQESVSSKNKISLNLTAINAPAPNKRTPFLNSGRSNKDQQIIRRSSNVAQTKHPIILGQNTSERRSAMMVCSPQQQSNNNTQHLNFNEFELTNEEETQRIKSSNRFADDTANQSLTQAMILNLEAGPQQSSLANNNTDNNDQLNVLIFENDEDDSQPIIAKQASIADIEIEQVDTDQNLKVDDTQIEKDHKIQQKTVKKKLVKGVSCSNVISKKKHFQRKNNPKQTMNQTKSKLYNHNVRSQENLIQQAQNPQLGIQHRRISATRKHQTRTRQKMEIIDLIDRKRLVSDTPIKRSIVIQQQNTDSNIYLKSTLKKQDLSPMKIGRGDILDSNVYVSENDELNSSAHGKKLYIKDYKNINQQQYDFEQNLSSGERQKSLQDSSKTRIFQKSKSSIRKSQLSITRRDVIPSNTKNVSLTLANSPQKAKKSPRKSCLGTPPQLEAVYNKDNMQIQGLSMQSARKLHSPRYQTEVSQRYISKVVKKPQKKNQANQNQGSAEREQSEASTLKRSSGQGENINNVLISQHSNQKIKKINIDTVVANKVNYTIDLQQCDDQDVINVQKDVPLHQKVDSTSKSLINMAQNRSDFNDLTTDQQNQVLAEQHKVLKNLDKLKSEAHGSKEDKQNSSVTIKSIVESLKALKSLQGLQTTRNHDLPEDSDMIRAQEADNYKTQKNLHAQEDQIGSPPSCPVDYTTNNFVDSNHSDLNQLKPKIDWEHSFQKNTQRAQQNELMIEGMAVTGKDTQRSKKQRRLSLQQKRQPPEMHNLTFDQFEAKNTGVGTDELEQLFGPISFRDGGKNQFNLDVEDLAEKTGLSMDHLNQVLNSQEFARLYSTTQRTRKESKMDVNNLYDPNSTDIANTKIGNITIYAAQTGNKPSYEGTLAGGRTGETSLSNSQVGSVFDVNFLNYLNSLTEQQKLELYQNQLNQACMHLGNRQIQYSPHLLTKQLNVKHKDQNFQTNSNVRSTSILAGHLLPRIIINNVKGKNKVVFIDPHQGKSQDYNRRMEEKQKGLQIMGQSVDVIKGTGPGSAMGVPSLTQQIQQLNRIHQDMMQNPENEEINSLLGGDGHSVDHVSSKHLNEISNNDLTGPNVLSPMSENQNLTFHNKSRKSVQQNNFGIHQNIQKIQSIRMNAKSVGKIRRQHQLLCDTVVKKRRNLHGDQQFSNQMMQPFDLQNRGPLIAASPMDMINLQIMNFDFEQHGNDGDQTRAILGSQLMEVQRGITQGAMFPFSSAELQADQIKLLNIIQNERQQMGQLQQSQEFGPRPAPVNQNSNGTYFFKPDDLMLGQELSAISNGGTLLNHQLQRIYQQNSCDELSPLLPQMSTQLVSRMRQTQGEQSSQHIYEQRSSVPPMQDRRASSLINPFDNLNLDTSQMTRQVGNTSQSFNWQLNQFDSKSRSSVVLNDNELMERVYNVSNAKQSRASPQAEQRQFKVEKQDSSLDREDTNESKAKKNSPHKSSSPFKGNDKDIKPQLVQNPPQVKIENHNANSIEDQKKVIKQKKQEKDLNSIKLHGEPDTLLQDSFLQTTPNDANLEQYPQIIHDDSFAGAVGQKTPLVQIRELEGKPNFISRNDGLASTGGQQAMKIPLETSLSQSQHFSQFSMSGQINDIIKMMNPTPQNNNETQQQTNNKEMSKNNNDVQNQRYTLKTSNQNKRSKYFGNLVNGRSVSNTRITNSNSKFSKTFYSMKQSKSNCSRNLKNTHISTQVPSFNNQNAYNKDIDGDTCRKFADPQQYYYVNQDQVMQHLLNFRESHKNLTSNNNINKTQNLNQFNQKKKSTKKVPQVSFSPIKIEELINNPRNQAVQNTTSTLRHEQPSTQIQDDPQGTLRNEQIHSVTTLKNNHAQKEKKTVKDILGGQDRDQPHGLQQKIMTQFKEGTKDKMMQLKSRQQQQFIEKWTQKNVPHGIHTQTQSYLQDGTLNSQTQSHSPNIFKHNITTQMMNPAEPQEPYSANSGIQIDNHDRIPSSQNLLQKRFNLSPSKSSIGFAQQTTIPLRSGALSHSNLSKKQSKLGCVQSGFQQLTEDESVTLTKEVSSKIDGLKQKENSHNKLSFNKNDVASNEKIAIQDHSSSRQLNVDISNLDDRPDVKSQQFSPTSAIDPKIKQTYDQKRDLQFEIELQEEVTITEDNEDTIANSMHDNTNPELFAQNDKFMPPKVSYLGELQFKHMFKEMSKNNHFVPTPGRFYEPKKTEKPYMRYTCSTKILKTDMGARTPLNLLEQYRSALKYGQNQYPKTPMSTRPVFSNFSDEQKFYSQQYKINPIDLKSHSQVLKNFEQIQKSEKISDFIRRQKRFPMSPPPMGQNADTSDNQLGDSQMSGNLNMTQEMTQNKFFDKRGTTFSPNTFNDKLTLSRESLQQITQIQNNHIEKQGMGRFTNLLKRNSSMKCTNNMANRTTKNIQQLRQSVGLKKGRVNLDRDTVMRSNGIQRGIY